MPLLTVEQNPDVTSRLPLVLRNTYDAAATEWITRECAAGTPADSCLHAFSRHRWGLPAIGHDEPIPAGGTRAIMSAPGADVTVVAVIYADGASAGDALVVRDLIEARQAMLDDLRQVLPILNAAAANPSQSYQALEATLSTRDKQFQALLQSNYRALGGKGEAPTHADRVCGPLIQDIQMSVKRGLTRPMLSVRYLRLAKMLAGWEQQLKASKPALK